jgi:hypothetical protein
MFDLTVSPLALSVERRCPARASDGPGTGASVP